MPTGDRCEVTEGSCCGELFRALVLIGHSDIIGWTDEKEEEEEEGREEGGFCLLQDVEMKRGRRRRRRKER